MIHDTTKAGARPPSSGTPISALVTNLREEIAILFSTTTSLLRKELEENIGNTSHALRSTAVGFTVLAIGGLMVALGIDLLFIALLAPDILSYETAAWVCTLSLASILSTIGILFYRRSSKKLSAEKLIPHKTLKTIEEHGDWIATKAEDLIK